jgi:hypothetical protein
LLGFRRNTGLPKKSKVPFQLLFAGEIAKGCLVFTGGLGSMAFQCVLFFALFFHWRFPALAKSSNGLIRGISFGGRVQGDSVLHVDFSFPLLVG